MKENRVIAADAGSSARATAGGAIGITVDREQLSAPGPAICPSAMRAMVTASVSETTAASVADQGFPGGKTPPRYRSGTGGGADRRPMAGTSTSLCMKWATSWDSNMNKDEMIERRADMYTSKPTT
jgi:hypothetical protein